MVQEAGPQKQKDRLWRESGAGELRVVVDTSTSFSALAYGGRPLEVLTAIQQSDSWELVVSPEMIAELQRVLRKKQKNTPAVIRALERYFSAALIETPTTAVEACPDKNDDMILTCAFSAGAQLLIASDSDLLALSRSPLIGELEVINVAEAYKRFVAETSTSTG